MNDNTVLVDNYDYNQSYDNDDINIIDCNQCTYKFSKDMSNCPLCGSEYIDLVEENFIKAYMEIPHTFINAKMIYLKAHINGTEIKFLVDTGAENSIIPENFIEACGLDKIIDRKYKGKLVGVGSCNIIGKIHYVEVVLPCGVFPCGFTISSNNDVPPILGIDLMHHLGITIDFKNKKLRFFEGYEVDF